MEGKEPVHGEHLPSLKYNHPTGAVWINLSYTTTPNGPSSTVFSFYAISKRSASGLGKISNSRFVCTSQTNKPYLQRFDRPRRPRNRLALSLKTSWPLRVPRCSASSWSIQVGFGEIPNPLHLVVKECSTEKFGWFSSKTTALVQNRVPLRRA